MVTRPAPQKAVEAEPAVDRQRAPFRFQATISDQSRDILLYEPSGGQRFILLQTVGIADEGAEVDEQLELVLAFAQMLRALFVEPADRQYVTGALARNQAELEDYLDLAKLMVEHWNIETDEPANRDERRARERRPAAAVARPRTRTR